MVQVLTEDAEWGPVIAGSLRPVLVAADDTGVPGDGVTSNRQPRLNGTAEAGSTVELLDAVRGDQRVGMGSVVRRLIDDSGIGAQAGRLRVSYTTS